MMDFAIMSKVNKAAAAASGPASNAGPLLVFVLDASKTLAPCPAVR